MKAHRIVVYVLDFEKYGIEDYKTTIGNAVDCVTFGKCSSAELGEWSDDHPCNQNGADMETMCDWKDESDANPRT